MPTIRLPESRSKLLGQGTSTREDRRGRPCCSETAGGRQGRLDRRSEVERGIRLLRQPQTVIDDVRAAEALTGMVVVEGLPTDSADLHLMAGALVHGQVTFGADRRPAARQLIMLRQEGPELPEGFAYEGYFAGRPVRRESTIRRTRTDRDGHYAFRVGPGDYLIGRSADMVHLKSTTDLVTVEAQDEIVRDLHIEGKRPDLGITGALMFGHRTKPFEGTGVFLSCTYCHMPHPRKREPRGPEPRAEEQR